VADPAPSGFSDNCSSLPAPAATSTGTSITPLSVPSLRTPTAIGLYKGRVAVHFTMTVEDGLITRGDVVLDPDRLADLNLVLDT
jgi:hypothetical protein